MLLARQLAARQFKIKLLKESMTMEKVVLSGDDLRALQLIELEMLVEVDRICRKHKIHYSLDGGTMLGAVRHKGFIPWDDDADVVFTRHEYAKFYRACKKDLDTERFFLQEHRTDPNYRWGYAKLRRKGTEFIRVNQEHMKYKTGVCIDIFADDNVPDYPLLRRLHHGVHFCIRKLLYAELGRKTEEICIMRMWYGLLYRMIPADSVFWFRNRIAAFVNRKRTELVCHTTYPNPRPACYYGFPSACFNRYIQMEFEGMMFSVLAGYDRYLKLCYGDYMQLPPPEKRVGPGEASCIRLIDITLEEIQERYRRENLKMAYIDKQTAGS